jgi:hypothetical protein
MVGGSERLPNAVAFSAILCERRTSPDKWDGEKDSDRISFSQILREKQVNWARQVLLSADIRRH